MFKSFFAKTGKYFAALFMLLVMIFGIVVWFKKRSYEDEITKLHNQIALQSKTIEVHKNAYAKKTVEIEQLNDVLKTFEKDSDLDKETIQKLRKLIKQKDDAILAANRIAVKWKKAYEAEAAAKQSEVPSAEKSRTRVDFDHDFGYIGVNGYTLTDPPYAKVSVVQNRPLMLTMALTQSEDKSWTTYVTSSEDNVAVDVKLSAVNPFVFKDKWYEKISLDMGMDMGSLNFYPYFGLSYPFGPISISGGIWGGNNGTSDIGWYATVNYSWLPFAKR